VGIPWAKRAAAQSVAVRKNLEAPMQFGIAGFVVGVAGFVGRQVQLAPQLRAGADAAGFTQQFPAAEQVRDQGQAQEARCLGTVGGLLQVDVHGTDCSGGEVSPAATLIR